MKITQSHTAAIHSRTDGDNKQALSASKILLIALAASVFFSFLAYRLTQEYFPNGFRMGLWEKAMQDYGFRYYQQHDSDSLRKALMRAPERMARNIDIPKIHIDIGFTELQKLYAKREQALTQGILEQGDDDFVPAKIRLGDRTVRIKLRLKGDWTDHLEGDKWSFRVHTKGDDQLFGLRRFSLQHPKTRGYQGEILFHETLRHFNVLTPRYFFVDAFVNGDNIGTMALEEHFSKELLERNGRKEGVIVRFDESLLWAAEDGKTRGFYGTFDSYLNAPIDAFQSSKIKKSGRLSLEYAIAVGMLRSFVNGALTASDVFDTDKLGSYLAVAEFWGAWHETRWLNQRFYLNPLTMKMEPIAFDANLQVRHKIGNTITTEPIVHKMLEDPQVNQAFMNAMDNLIDEVNSGALIERLKQVEKPHLEILQKEFVLLETFDYEELKKRAKRIPDRDIFPIYVHAYLIQENGSHYLEIANPLPHEIEVQFITWVDKAGNTHAFEPKTPIDYPLTLPKTELNVAPKFLQIDFEALPIRPSQILEIKANIKGYTQAQITRARRYFRPLDKNPMPVADVDSLLTRNPFLALSDDGTKILVQSGRWQVVGDIVIPTGHELVIPSGTTLQFEKDRSLVVYGATLFQGTIDAPIVLEATPSADSSGTDTWQGIAIYYAPKRSIWSHVSVRNTTGIDKPLWKLTGGVTFYKSDIDLTDSTLIGNKSEDALNIVHSDFNLSNVNFIDTTSDAFDSDFATGTVSGGLFNNIGIAGGGDGVDVSGSKVTIEGTQFIQVNDKAISVGERSISIARGIIVDGCGVGAASKDNSSLEISDSTIRNARNAALMAYTKKTEYGPASLVASNMRILDTATPALVQQGSRVELNGEQMNTEDMDIKGLYKTIMKPGISR